MTVECVGCQHLNRKDAPREWRDLGFLVCNRAPFRGHYVNPTWPRECTRFAPCAPDEADARRQWLASRPR